MVYTKDEVLGQSLELFAVELGGSFLILEQQHYRTTPFIESLCYLGDVAQGMIGGFLPHSD